MNPTLMIFSGLPGTGKTTLARLAATQLHSPLIRLDDLLACIPPHMLKHANPFWDDLMRIVLHLAEAQLPLGMSVIIDAVFMGADRVLAQDIATKHHATFRAIYTYVSDERLWRERVIHRCTTAPLEDRPATWEGILEQRKTFQSWRSSDALFIDAVNPIERNLAQVLTFVTGPGRDRE